MRRTCLLACAVLAAAAVAVPPVPAADDEKLLIVIRTKPELKLSDIESAVGAALTTISPTKDKDARDVITGRPDVKQITTADFNAYVRLGSPDDPLVPVPSIKDKDGLIEVRQQPASVPTWEFNLLGVAPRELTKLEVVFDDAPAKPETFTPTTKRDDPLTLTQFGSYVLKPPVKAGPAGTGDPKEPAPKEGKLAPKEYRQPLTYVAHVRGLGEKEVKQVSGEWPKEDNYFLIRLNGFRGNREELEKTIRDSEKVGGAALDAFKLNTGVTLAIGEAGASEDELGVYKFEGNKLFINVPQLRTQRTHVKRAYMLFPFASAKDADAQATAFNKFGTGQVIAEIKKQKPTPPDQAVILAAGAQPQWLELPLIDRNGAVTPGLNPGSFGRVVTLVSDKPAALVPEAFKALADKLPEAHGVVVYEFDNGVIQNAVFYKRTPNQKERTLANRTEIPEWGIQLGKMSLQPKGGK